MNAVLLLAASLIAFQGDDQKVTGSIVHDTGITYATPYSIVFPKGRIKFSGPVTKIVVRTWAGHLDKSGNFVEDKTIASGEATSVIPAKLPPKGEFNWLANSFTFPGNPTKTAKAITVKATLELYVGPELKVKETSYETIK